jgi:hypothetical protein
MKLAFAVVLAGTASLCGQALAHPAAPCANGSEAIIRVSKINPGSSIEAFDKAAHDHLAWYRSHGFKDNDLDVATVLAPGAKSAALAPSKNQVMTIHYNPPDFARVNAMHDKAWDAFIGEYRASSTVIGEYTVCLPKHR